MIPSTQFASLAEAGALPARPLHLAIGMFDGVHLGHRSVIEAAIQSARRVGGISGVLTFWPHPSRMFRPEEPTRMINSPEIKARLVRALGVDVQITQPFDSMFAAIEARDFLPQLKRHLPHLSTIYVGENWRFGRGRQGDIALLLAAAKTQGVSVVSAPRINQDGEAISSTRIRASLQAGEIEAANAMLGYSYFAEGKVTPGKQLGRTIGFPTLNLIWEPDLRPRLGVYAVRLHGTTTTESLRGVANYGLRPTVESSVQPRLEVHILQPCSYGAGDDVVVDWLAFLRPETRFAGIEALRAQIARDRGDAERWFASRWDA